jgi:hypothetical protein
MRFKETAMSDDLDAQRKRAERLHSKIDELARPQNKRPAEETDEKETSAEFVRRKMAELDQKKP